MQMEDSTALFEVHFSEVLNEVEADCAERVAEQTEKYQVDLNELAQRFAEQERKVADLEGKIDKRSVISSRCPPEAAKKTEV